MITRQNQLFRVFFYTLLLVVTFDVEAQHLYQQPKPLFEKSTLDEIIGQDHLDGNYNEKLKILWVYGYDEHHIAGAHDYVKVKDLMNGLLSTVSNVEVDEAFEFPSEQQFHENDVIVMFLHLPQLKKKHFDLLQNFIEKGGGVVCLHETVIMRPSSKGNNLANCLGFAWNEGKSKWGAIFDEITIDNQHPIFKRFNTRLTINDEFYWDLFQESEGVNILGSVRTGPAGESVAPLPKDRLSLGASPVFWTYQIGKGKVFGTTTGHHTFTYYDPEFRIILFRSIAWVANRKPGPLMPLVFKGITKEDGMVGITENLRYWEGKKRPQ